MIEFSTCCDQNRKKEKKKHNMKREKSVSSIWSDLEVHDDGLDQEENGWVILPVDVGGRFTKFDTGDGSALHQLLTTTLAR